MGNFGMMLKTLTYRLPKGLSDVPNQDEVRRIIKDVHYWSVFLSRDFKTFVDEVINRGEVVFDFTLYDFSQAKRRLNTYAEITKSGCTNCKHLNEDVMKPYRMDFAFKDGCGGFKNRHFSDDVDIASIEQISTDVPMENRSAS